VEANGVHAIETVSGPPARLELRRGSWLVGRGSDAHLRIASDQVSTRHAWIRRDGKGTWIVDAGSTNGTWLNGTKLSANQEYPLRLGDRLRFGPVNAVYGDPAHGTRVWQPPSSGMAFGDVSAGTFNNAGRDINHHDNRDQRRYHRNQFEFTTPEGQALNELATGRGPGRAIMVLGLLVMVAGFALFGSVVFKFMGAVSDGIRSDSPPSPSDMPSLLGPPIFGGIPQGAAGFALFGIGMVLTVIGMVMSKAAREKRRQRQPRRDDW
jgi:FHA domain-containing protein